MEKRYIIVTSCTDFNYGTTSTSVEQKSFKMIEDAVDEMVRIIISESRSKDGLKDEEIYSFMNETKKNEFIYEIEDEIVLTYSVKEINI